MKKRLVFCCLLFLLPLFFLGGPGYYSSRSLKAGWDLGHILFFLPFSWLLCTLYLDRRPKGGLFALFLKVLGTVLLVGVCIELLQTMLHGRSASMNDVLRNLLGTLLAFAFFCPVHRADRRVTLVMKVLGVLLLGLACWPLARSLYDEHLAGKQFPLLADFETAFELERFRETDRVRLATTPSRHGSHSMRLQLTTETYSGVTLFYFPRNWEGYTRLAMSIHNPQDRPVRLHVRVNDRLHGEHGRRFEDRFHRLVTLQPGWNDLEFSLEAIREAPEGRFMDLRQIELLGIFVARETEPLTLYLDWLRLER